jgi:small subunit ribosomal protein S6
MDSYEITYLVDSEDKSKSVTQLITSTGATYRQTKDWGERELAYPINKHTKARYYTGIIETLATNVTEINKKLNFSDMLIRFLIVKQEE